MLNLIILGLATWRISSLLVNEKGPGNIFIRIRELTGIQHDNFGDPYMIPERFFSQVLSCVWCCSVWVAMAFTVIYKLIPFWEVIAYPFALSAIAVTIQTYVGKEV